MPLLPTASALTIALIGSACLASSAVKETPLGTVVLNRYSLQGQTLRICGNLAKQIVRWILWTPQLKPSPHDWSVAVRGCDGHPPALDERGCLVAVLNRWDGLTVEQAIAAKRTFAAVHGHDGSYVVDQVCPPASPSPR